MPPAPVRLLRQDLQHGVHLIRTGLGLDDGDVWRKLTQRRERRTCGMEVLDTPASQKHGITPPLGEGAIESQV